MQQDVFITACGGASANKFPTFIGLLTSHRNFHQILNSEIILMLHYGFSDPLHTVLFLYALTLFHF